MSFAMDFVLLCGENRSVSSVVGDIGSLEAETVGAGGVARTEDDEEGGAEAEGVTAEEEVLAGEGMENRESKSDGLFTGGM